MKILEPFAGIRLASGHALLHLALFIGTFFVQTKEARASDYPVTKDFEMNNDDIDLLPYHDEGNVNEVMTAFIMLRYAHLAAFLLHFPVLFYNNENKRKNLDSFVGVEDMAQHKKIERQNVWRTCDKFTTEMTILVYLGPIFFAQYLLLKFQYFFEEDLSTEEIGLQNSVKEMSPVRDWIIIELFSFYVYLHATVFYIMGYQFNNWYSKTKTTKTDIAKTNTDFILYTKKSLIWFAFNLVLCVMPIFLVMIVYKRRAFEVCPTALFECDPQYREEEDTNYKILTTMILFQCAASIL